MDMGRTKLVLGTSILLLVSVQVNAELLINGGFEEPLVGNQFGGFEHRNGFELTGWESFSTWIPGTGEDPGSVHFNTNYASVTEGNQAVQLEVPGDWIRQDFVTTIGQRYTLSLDFSAFSDTATLGITVSSASVVLNALLFQWETHTVDFITDSTLTTLTLTNQGGTGTFPHIDNVSIVPARTPVTIDIKPDSDPNSVNPRSNGVIPVAILGSIDFDATQVDFTTVTFGPTGASPAHDGHVENVNDDDFMDMMFHFKTQETGIVCGDTEATLMGETSDDQITGTDTVNTVGCKDTISEKSTTSASSMSSMMLLALGVLGLWRFNRRQ
jgi:hypothetical protein